MSLVNHYWKLVKSIFFPNQVTILLSCCGLYKIMTWLLSRDIFIMEAQQIFFFSQDLDYEPFVKWAPDHSLLFLNQTCNQTDQDTTCAAN